ncbi:hypothetical protein [Lacrimispora sphenoides]|uniref:hypothetical protein n=1 Tax=Lacrimispora sphenoides TaxID=29370 RepID=UPI0006D155CE|nr:hypothetical protein [Lacrimispora sphenoides]
MGGYVIGQTGWKQEGGGWRFYNGDTGQPIQNDWHQDQDKWYWFDTLIAESGKVYCLDGEGKMVVEPVTLTPDKDGALR